MSRIVIAPADRLDEVELRFMQAASFRSLGRSFYETSVIESFINDVGTMDNSLLLDGTYFKASEDGRIVGSGGWSWRTPAYALRAAGHRSAVRMKGATVRSIFVHADHAGRGIGRDLMAVIEANILAAGFDVSTLMATLCGIPFYRRLGYGNDRPVELRLPNEGTFVGMDMEKSLATAATTEDKAA